MATETWVLNEVLLNLTEQIFNVNFTSNGQSYAKLFIYIPDPSQQIIMYGETSVYMSDLDGWTNEAYRTIVLDSPATGDLLTWLTADGVKQTPSTPRLSVDLTTLPGWSSLSDGSHSITVVAKANGYRDSEPSAAVSVTKGGAFKQVFPTKTSDNCTLFENLNQSKIYSINTSSYYNILKYENGTWMTTFGGSIEAQTDNSVKMKIMDGNTFEAIVSGVTLEGDTEAAVSDFEGFSPTTVYAMWICFVEGTKITLSNGSTKLVQDMQYGDKVLCYDFTNGVQTSSYIDWMIPERVATRYWEITLSDGTILNLVGSNGKSHRLYNITKQRFDYPQDFEPSDLTLKEDGTTAYVLSCREIEKTVKFYNIASNEHINVYANGVLTSNRLNNRFKIVDNKFTDEKVMTDKEVIDYLDYLNAIKAV